VVFGSEQETELYLLHIKGVINPRVCKCFFGLAAAFNILFMLSYEVFAAMKKMLRVSG